MRATEIDRWLSGHTRELVRAALVACGAAALVIAWSRTHGLFLGDRPAAELLFRQALKGRSRETAEFFVNIGTPAIAAAAAFGIAVLIVRRVGLIYAASVAAAPGAGALASGLEHLIGEKHTGVFFMRPTPAELIVHTPSGHASFIAALLTSLVLLARSADRRLLLGASVIIGGALCAALIARGAHMLSDLVAGALLGIAWSLIAALAAGYLRTEHGRQDSLKRQSNDTDYALAPGVEGERTAHDDDS